MHLFNMAEENKKNMKKVLCYLYILSTLVGCYTSQDKEKSNKTLVDTSIVNEEIEKTITKKDSIIYELPVETTRQIKKMIKNKNVSRCELIYEYEVDGFVFTFPYGNKKERIMKRDSLLLQRTNTFLKIDSIYLPITTLADDFFCNLPRDCELYFNEFNHCSVVVNAQGNILESFSF